MRAGLHRLSTLTLGPTSFLQDVLPSMLATPSSYFEENLKQLAQNALKLTSQRSSVTLLPNSLMPKRIMSKGKQPKKTEQPVE